MGVPGAVVDEERQETVGFPGRGPFWCLGDKRSRNAAWKMIGAGLGPGSVSRGTRRAGDGASLIRAAHRQWLAAVPEERCRGGTAAG